MSCCMCGPVLGTPIVFQAEIPKVRRGPTRTTISHLNIDNEKGDTDYRWPVLWPFTVISRQVKKFQVTRTNITGKRVPDPDVFDCKDWSKTPVRDCDDIWTPGKIQSG